MNLLKALLFHSPKMEPEPAQKVGSSSNFKSAPAEKPWLRPALQHCPYVNV